MSAYAQYIDEAVETDMTAEVAEAEEAKHIKNKALELTVRDIKQMKGFIQPLRTSRSQAT